MNLFKLLTLFLLVFLSTFVMAQKQQFKVLNNEKWSLSSKSLNGSFGRGNTWLFYKDNTFKATSWYSGGAYWTHHYEGKYVYNAENRTVFLTYKKDNKLPVVDKMLCIQIIYVDANNYYPVFYNTWKKENGKYNPLGKGKIETKTIDTAVKNSTFNLFEQTSFKIEKL